VDFILSDDYSEVFFHLLPDKNKNRAVRCSIETNEVRPRMFLFLGKHDKEDNMVETIGAVAGKIWEVLKDGNEVSVAQLKKNIEGDAFLLNAAIGWLAREDKLKFSKMGNALKLSLK
jgi:hypothetical protein